MNTPSTRIETKLVHAGEPSPRIGRAVVTPIFQSAMTEYAGETNYNDLGYIRLNNTPNHAGLHKKLAELESAEDALVTASGMAAISTTLLTVLGRGGHLLAQSSLYGGTQTFLAHDFEALGFTVDFVDGENREEWEQKRKPNTRAFYVESATNPLVQVADLEGVVSFCRDHGLVSIIDNTFPSPVNFRPVERGFDLSVYSCTKSLNGHSDIVAGAVVGKRDLVQAILLKLNHLGGCLDPHACFLLSRGMKTLALRIRHQNESALKIARFLAGHPAVEQVNYPGLESHPQHERARQLFDGFGYMLSFELGGDVAATQAFMNRTTLPILAPSLGGVESLLTRPCTTSHAGLTAQEREAAGISDRLIRASIGIEATEDLIADFRQALEG